MHGVDLKQHHGTCTLGRIRWREHGLFDGEGNVGIGDDGAVWIYLQGSGNWVKLDWNRIAFDLRPHTEMTQKLYREQPRLKGAFLLAYEHALRPGDRERRPRTNFLFDAQSIGNGLHGGDGMKWCLANGGDTGEGDDQA